jgi:hypothetical protein
MKKLFTSTLIISSLILAPALKADDIGTDPQTEEQTEEQTDEQTEESQPEDTQYDEGTPVSQESTDNNRSAKRKRWQNIALAVGAVAIAITALILVANNDGHHGKSHHHR